jgi:tetratricopeptide (TPR) repeat protein
MAGNLLGSAPDRVVDRVCEAAEGNPLYLEQLTASLEDQGLLADGRWLGSDDAAIEIPTTLQALLTARLDRLESTPRLVLERASVEGRRFRLAASRALASEVPPEEFDAAIETLDRRGLIQPEDEAAGAWRFAHALVMEAAYRGLSKEVRAELHERLADWMTGADAEQPDVDESVARHLERSVHLREELGARDDGTAAISARAGELFGAAGARAFAALDYLTAVDLLGRAVTLLPPGAPRRLDLLPNLAVALMNTGRADEVEGVLSEGDQTIHAVGTERDVLRARVQLLRNRLYRSSPDEELGAAAAEARAAFERFESMRDDVGAAEAALAVAVLEYAGERRAEVHSWTLVALRRALAAGRVAEASDAASNLAASAFEGPLPYGAFPAAAAELSSLSEDPVCGCTGHALQALAALASGQDAEASEHERRFREVVERHGLIGLGAEISLIIAEAEVWTGAPEAGERRLREAREVIEPFGDIWWTNAADNILCPAVWAQNRPREFLRLADALEASAFVGDRAIRIGRQSTRARAQLLRGRTHDAEISARRGIEMADASDLLQEHARALIALSEVLEARGRHDEGVAARLEAIGKLEAKGFVTAAARLAPEGYLT